jgi:hypothetical protein
MTARRNTSGPDQPPAFAAVLRAYGLIALFVLGVLPSWHAHGAGDETSCIGNVCACETVCPACCFKFFAPASEAVAPTRLAKPPAAVFQEAPATAPDVFNAWAVEPCAHSPPRAQ